MPTNKPDTVACPVCGEAYDQRIVVERGDSWGDIVPGPPFYFFTKYRRRCSARYDAETDTVRSGDEHVVYFHGETGGASVT